MKKIKIRFLGVWENFYKDNPHILKILRRHYDLEVTDSDPDYIICSVFGKPYEYCNYPQVRIMFTGENYIPDFNLVDYGICNYPLKLQDRNFYFPFCIDEFGHCESLTYKDRNYDKSILDRKTYFANFIAGHESEYSIRGDFFKKLCEYKRVESAGTYLNNMPDHQTVRWNDDSKRQFQEKCKFTLCFESTKHEGFVTEKITDAFYADTIPVYYGSDNVKDIFNEKAFINCADYESFDAVVEKIKELDNDDEKYMEMLRQPIFVEEGFPQKKLKELEEYICHIFDQPIEKAYRRSRVYSPMNIDCYLAEKGNSHSCSGHQQASDVLYKIKVFVAKIMRARRK